MVISLADGFKIGSAAGGLFSGLINKGADRSEDILNDAIRDVNLSRVSRNIRYEQGLQAVSQAASGNTQYGNYLSIVADDQRKAEERRTQIFLNNSFQKIGRDANNPSTAQRIFGFAGTLAEVSGGSIFDAFRKKQSESS